ncbi:MAG: MBL fold metallo-hydrolase [Spirochaetes bacterium]|nr:MBL fold metallo-hydrolase [Sedimentisphaerales bacterium]MBN2769075.1 MBL fold metallo-hydrolase [Spirochaetota bacterium]
MKIELWGVRGSLPTPLTNNEYQLRVRSIIETALTNSSSKTSIDDIIKLLPSHVSTLYGGNTTCVTVKSRKGNLAILDAGTGLRPLGDQLITEEAGEGKLTANFFFTHTHWDHIQGLPFFKPLYIKGNKFIFNSPIRDLHERLNYQQKFKFFPREFDDTDSVKEFNQLKLNESFTIDDSLIVDFIPLRHPGGSFAYRFREGEKSFIFSTDVEFRGNAVESFTSDHGDFFCSADLLILDSQYTLDEAFAKFDWGHTSYSMAVNCGINWKVKKLVLTHHEPSYSDEKLSSIYSDAQEHMNASAKAAQIEVPELFLATEGMVFDI